MSTEDAKKALEEDKQKRVNEAAEEFKALCEKYQVVLVPVPSLTLKDGEWKLVASIQISAV